MAQRKRKGRFESEMRYPAITNKDHDIVFQLGPKLGCAGRLAQSLECVPGIQRQTNINPTTTIDSSSLSSETRNGDPNCLRPAP